MRRSLALAAGLVLGATFLSGPAHAAPTTGFRFIDITTSDSVVLKANVIEPTTPGRHPAIVFPSSWALNDLEYVVQATKLAEGGYTVVSYTPRGWWSSGGEIDTAGPKDIADASRVIDWAIANTTADAARVGMAGVSYGAGISLITAAKDSRVRAVAALSGWSDLVGSLYGGDTRRLQSSGLLVGSAALLGDTSPEFDARIGDFFANRNIGAVKDFARIRSAGTYLAGLNASAPAVLLANGYGDSIFPPNQLVDFYGGLTGPKRLEFAPGDHAIPELTGLIGLDNHVWTSTRRWFDRYLQGVANGIDTEAPVVLRSMTGGATESYPTWSAAATSTSRLGLGEVHWWDGTGDLGGTPATGWSRRTGLSSDTVAKGGVILLSNGLQALTGIAPTAWIPAVNRLDAGVWISGGYGSTQKVRGIPSLHLRLTPNQSKGTVVAYLYDVDWAGTGELITQAPISWLDATPGSARTLDLKLPAVSWDVPAGHKLALVIDGEDGYYLDENSLLSAATFSGPSWLDVPLR
ncbi:hypothetical protein F4553_003274 [Allocatelliglobosispora scoriae]|uniref:Xaa-Pro dipeptidyl-peptidase C-terminal domain-containing protein n=1 Tax=Allocatelliglobosispora scoriae TaxID=643052 RepID=A0A841BQC0_9ACTN|nr:CocE/NonD family hydrolase [Allocatelliglobosispora scoriae]MBB5869895.1 hypothetical protein [Allocatelliglobosispora scoriae]